MKTADFLFKTENYSVCHSDQRRKLLNFVLKQSYSEKKFLLRKKKALNGDPEINSGWRRGKKELISKGLTIFSKQKNNPRKVAGVTKSNSSIRLN